MGLTSAESVAGSRIDAVVDLAAELIRIPSENPPGNAYDACVELLCDRLEGLGLAAERVHLGEGRTAVLSGTGEGPPVYLHGHYDVVPATVEGQFEPGVNAFEGAAPVVQALLAWKEEVRSRKTAFNIEPAEARESILMLGGEARGGHQFNLVPKLFVFTVERRFNPEEDLATERERLLRLVRESTPPGVGVEVDVFQEAPSSSVSESAPLVVELSRAVEAVTGEAPVCELCPGLLETRFYAETGIPAVAYGPGDLDVSHGPEESVDVARLEACTRIYADCVTRLAAAGGR